MKDQNETKYINPWRLFNGAFIPNWLLERESSEVSHGAKLCYARLCQFAGKDGKCFPKQNKIAQEIGVKARQVRTYISELEDKKLIEVVKPDYQARNTYKFLNHAWMYQSIRQKTAALDGQETAGLIGRKPSAHIVRDSIQENHFKESRKELSSQFVPPTVEEVKAYCQERRNQINPNAFHSFYQSKGWMIGKNKMTNWKDAVITWEQRGNTKPVDNTPRKQPDPNCSNCRGSGEIYAPGSGKNAPCGCTKQLIKQLSEKNG